MAFADNLYVLWEPRLVVMQSTLTVTAQLLLNSIHTFGDVAGLDFVFHMFFLIKYSKSLEEGSFRGRSADFLWMLLIGQRLLGFCTLQAHKEKMQVNQPFTDLQPLLTVLWLCRRSSAHLLCAFCQYPVSWVVSHLHDGKSHRLLPPALAQQACQQIQRRSHLSSRQQVAWHAGVCLGTTASVCHPQLLGHLHIHSTLSSLGAAGLQCGPAQLACGGLDGDACRYPAAPFINASHATLVHWLTSSHALLTAHCAQLL